jgi:hypothetical protein
MVLKELTAKEDRCGDSLTCPAVFEEVGLNKLVIVGARAAHVEVVSRVGAGEVALEIDRRLVARAIGGRLSRLLLRVGL